MKISTKEMAVFAMLGAVMYASKIIMEFAPNIHLLGVFTIEITIVYRKKALYPIYIFVLLNGMFSGTRRQRRRGKQTGKPLLQKKILMRSDGLQKELRNVKDVINRSLEMEIKLL